MLVDEYEQYPNEKTDVVVVSRSGSDEPEPAPSATDRMFSFTILSPPRRRGTTSDSHGCIRWMVEQEYEWWSPGKHLLRFQQLVRGAWQWKTTG